LKKWAILGKKEFSIPKKGHTWKKCSHLKKMVQIWKNWSHLKKIGYSKKSVFTLGKKVTLGKMGHTWKKVTLEEIGHIWKNGSHLEKGHN